MATYYIKSTGSNTSPYDTPATGCTSLSGLNDSGLLVNGDIVNVCSNMIEDITWNKCITFKSNDSTKYRVGAGDGYIAFSPSTSADCIIDGLTLYRTRVIFPPPGYSTSVQVRNCVFDTDTANFASIFTPIFSPSVIIENNFFDLSSHNYPVATLLGVYDNINSGEFVCNSIRINNNLLYHNNPSQLPTVYNSFCGIITYAITERLCPSVKIYNNIVYNITNDPTAAIFSPSEGGPSIPMTNLLFENNNIYNGKRFFGGDYPEDAGIVSTSNTTVKTSFDYRYILLLSSPLYGTGYDGVQIGLGLYQIRYGIITSSYTTSGTGTATSPYTYTQLKDYINNGITENNTIYVSGTYYTSSTSDEELFKQNADDSIIGNVLPWGDYFKVVNTSGYVLVQSPLYNDNNYSDCIFGKSKLNGNNKVFNNCIFYDELISDTPGTTGNMFLNCTFVNTNIILTSGTSEYATISLFYNCVFYNTTFENRITSNVTLVSCISNTSFGQMFYKWTNNPIYSLPYLESHIYTTNYLGIDNNKYSYPFNVGYSNPVTDGIVNYNTTNLPYTPFKNNRKYKDGLMMISDNIYNNNSIAFGKTIKGYGTYIFDDFYVDFDLERPSSTSAFNFVGSSTNPMTYDEMYSLMTSEEYSVGYGAIDKDIFRIRGSRVDTTESNTLGSPAAWMTGSIYTMAAWDREKYGPWQLKFTSTNSETLPNDVSLGQYSLLNINDGILESNVMYLDYVNEINDSFLYSNYMYFNDSVSAYGSTFIAGVTECVDQYALPWLETDMNVYMKDCCINFTSFNPNSAFTSGNVGVYIYNSVTTSPNSATLLSGADTSGTSGCQYGWTPPMWPEFDSGKYKYLYSTLTESPSQITISGSGGW